jgi:hypothetical protein
MRHNRIWIEILLLGTGIACAVALLFACLGAAASASAGPTAEPTAEPGHPQGAAQQESPATAAQTYEGMVTCSRCGARHSGDLGQTAADCARICVRGGASFVLVQPDATYVLDGDLGVLGRLAGQRARIVGTSDGKTIRITTAASEV